MSTDRLVTIMTTNKFQLIILDDSLREWSRCTVVTIHTKCGEFHNITRHWNAIKNFPKLSLFVITIESSYDDRLFKEQTHLDKVSELRKKLCFINSYNISITERFLYDTMRNVRNFQTWKLHTVVGLKDFFRRPSIF